MNCYSLRNSAEVRLFAIVGVFGFLAALSFSNIGCSRSSKSAIVTTAVEVNSFEPNLNSGQIMVDGQVCPPLFFGQFVSASELQPQLRAAFAARINQWLQANPGYRVKETSFNTQLTTDPLRSSEGGNRCTYGSAVYNIEKCAFDAAPVIQRLGKKIKVAIRDGFPGFAVKTDDGWQGIDVLFAEKIGRQLGCGVQFVEVNGGVENCLNYVINGLADMAISNISITKERIEEGVKFSQPYFSTGIVLATLNAPTYKYVAKYGVNDKKINLIVASGSTAEKLVKKSYPEAFTITVPKTPEIYNQAKMREAGERFNGVVMVTDEAIVAGWKGVMIIGGGEARISDEDYGVVVRDDALLATITRVIKDENIIKLYQETVGR
ncbi:MAG TPA: transporter substrate-binding domain-containing protein [Candidatus Methylomirabilis sp.]|nr:transporter substrate-binding domain-containing protein [Candidatus Methylomirabilis sp.]